MHLQPSWAFFDRSLTIESSHGEVPITGPLQSRLVLLDLSFWSLALDRVVERESKTIQELKKVMHDFASGISDEQLRKMARLTRHRAELCMAERGGYLRGHSLGDRRGTR